MATEVALLAVSALGWFGGLPVPPGVGENTGWAPPASWDTEAGGLVDENGNPVVPTDPEPPTYPPSETVPPAGEEPPPDAPSAEVPTEPGSGS
ncbi:hypothetical protein [Saccharopolyspora rosea]|uniref:hypothetical protein n=1 Tax=Saccharopolyspora rosea TaxID=524884 RepID=UPI0021D838A9|nr:hypothetical protein [Saccharopolyspora rosea]